MENETNETNGNENCSEGATSAFYFWRKKPRKVYEYKAKDIGVVVCPKKVLIDLDRKRRKHCGGVSEIYSQNTTETPPALTESTVTPGTLEVCLRTPLQLPFEKEENEQEDKTTETTESEENARTPPETLLKTTETPIQTTIEIRTETLPETTKTPQETAETLPALTESTVTTGTLEVCPRTPLKLPFEKEEIEQEDKTTETTESAENARTPPETQLETTETPIETTIEIRTETPPETTKTPLETAETPTEAPPETTKTPPKTTETSSGTLKVCAGKTSPKVESREADKTMLNPDDVCDTIEPVPRHPDADYLEEVDNAGREVAPVKNESITESKGASEYVKAAETVCRELIEKVQKGLITLDELGAMLKPGLDSQGAEVRPVGKTEFQSRVLLKLKNSAPPQRELTVCYLQ